jgi:cell division transport system ATP-binding protein
MVDRMRRRVIEVSRGSIVRDERAGSYAGTETTREFAALLRDEPTLTTRRFARREGDEPEREA